MFLAKARKTRGGAMLELALLSPWIIMLFIGALDWGFYGYSLITLENAARAAVLYTSQKTANASDTTTTCTILLNEMSTLPNMGTVTTCNSSPLVLSLSSPNGPDGASASQVSVTYTTPAMIPIPGLLAKQFTITRTVKMRIAS
jgi:Flp pilus assembly protein TadG